MVPLLDDHYVRWPLLDDYEGKTISQRYIVHSNKLTMISLFHKTSSDAPFKRLGGFSCDNFLWIPGSKEKS